MLSKAEKQFLWSWMDDVGRYEMPDLANFKPKWEEAQKLNILDYNEYKNYKRKDAKNTFKDKINKISNSISSSSMPIVTEGKLSNQTINNLKVKLFIEKYIELINSEDWDSLFDDHALYELEWDDVVDLVEILNTICDADLDIDNIYG